MVMGIAIIALSEVIGGSSLKDFFANVLLGLSFGEMLVGAYVVGCSIAKQ